MSREAEIRARVEAATPGPWFRDMEEYPDDYREDLVPYVSYRDEDGRVRTLTEWYQGVPDDQELGWYVYPDAAFIAHAREDVPWLLEQLEEARALARELAEALREAQRHHGGREA